jgi:hypothetical protein
VVEALLRGEIAEDGIDYLVGFAEHVKKRLDQIAGVKE